MNPRTALRSSLAAVVLWCSAASTQAHDPFDVSVRMTVRPDGVEATVTLGVDAARQLLSRAGFPDDEVAGIVRPRGPHSTRLLPAPVAAHFLALDRDGERLEAGSVTGLSDGLEVLFTLRYPRPKPGTLNVRAVCYAEVPQLRQGSLVADDENANRLGAALLSQGLVNARVTVPDPKSPGESSPGGLSPSDPPSATSASPPSPAAGDFFRLGVGHILGGFDHLLFLVVLLVGVRSVPAMLGIITCFTVAHSVTLALAALDLVRTSPRIVEPLIAASIIVVCLENFWRRNAAADRLWLAGGFGLIHGFGFAGALRETGLGHEGASLVTPLFSFNFGVETGQLLVAALFLPALFLMRRWHPFERHGARAVSTMVLAVSGYWLWERTVWFK